MKNYLVTIVGNAVVKVKANSFTVDNGGNLIFTRPVEPVALYASGYWYSVVEETNNA